MVHLESGEIVSLYRTQTQSENGPGVGAAAFHPSENRAVFIHGLESCSAENPYSFARRFGAILNVECPGIIHHADARVVHGVDGSRRSAIGVLSGGTHAHSWNDRGWLSFTYNDAWLERTARVDNRVRDARTVGFMFPGNAPVEVNNGESFGGSMKAFLAARLCEKAQPGSDEIEQAVEECWIGRNGYIDNSGVHHANAIAFQGAVRNELGELIHEVLICDLSIEELAKLEMETWIDVGPGELLLPVAGCRQRRLTHTASRRFPGIQGARNWLVSSPDGTCLYAPMRDERGIVQIHRIEIASGRIDQLTQSEQSIEGQISLNPAGTHCSAICDQRICLTDVRSGKSIWQTDHNGHRLIGAVHFSGENRMVYNRMVGDSSQGYVQVFTCEWM